MVRILLDTCVLSELQRPQGNPTVRARVEGLDPFSVFMSVVTLGELAKGIALLNPGARERELASWLIALENQYADRMLEIDADVARMWGELTARAQTQGVPIPAADGLIAATAMRHGLHVMTHNTRHFAGTGVQVIDPWQP